MVPLHPKDRLRAVIVLGVAEAVGGFLAVAHDARTRQRARRFLNVCFGVAAPLAEAEEFHHLTREVLVRLPLCVLVVVEVREHRWVAQHGTQEVSIAPEGASPQRLVLASDVVRLTHVLIGRGEDAVPEEREPIAQRILTEHHASDPISTQTGELQRVRLDNRTPVLPPLVNRPLGVLDGVDPRTAVDVGRGQLLPPYGPRSQEVVHERLGAGLDPASDIPGTDPEPRAIPDVLDLAGSPGELHLIRTR